MDELNKRRRKKEGRDETGMGSANFFDKRTACGANVVATEGACAFGWLVGCCSNARDKRERRKESIIDRMSSAKKRERERERERRSAGK